jgi:hypothetical protein
VFDQPRRAPEGFRLEEDWSSSDLQYDFGFFDGYGCASAATSAGPRLSVTQAAAHGEDLKFSMCLFGGSINVSKHGTGTRQRTVQWSLVG